MLCLSDFVMDRKRLVGASAGLECNGKLKFSVTFTFGSSPRSYDSVVRMLLSIF